MDLLVSIISMNNRDLLRDCLRSLREACDGITYKVVVVDNASTDGSAVMVADEHADVDLVINEHPHGFGRNHNAVLRAVFEGRIAPTPRYVCILNDDMLLHTRSLSTLVSHMDADPRAGVIGPMILDGAGVVQHTFFRYPSLWTDLRVFLRRPRALAQEEAAWLDGSCLLVRTTALERIGAFDERFFLFAEDVDLCLRINRAGYLVRHVRDASVVHYGHASVARAEHGSRMEKQMLRSRYLLEQKYHGTGRARRTIALHRTVLLARAGAHSLRSLRGREPSRPLARLLVEKALYDPRRPLEHETKSLRHTPPVWMP